MSDPVEFPANGQGGELRIVNGTPGNDNHDRFDSLTKQGLLLMKAFYAIEDPKVRYEVLRHVQQLAGIVDQGE